jgi:hypothetical protein
VRRLERVESDALVAAADLGVEGAAASNVPSLMRSSPLRISA